MHYLATALIAAVGWSIPPLIDRFNLRYVNSISILAFRALIIGIIGIVTLFIITKKRQINIKEAVEKKGKLIIILLLVSAFSGYLLGHFGFYTSLGKAKGSVVQVVLISHCLPVILVAILAPIIYKDKINFKMVLGIIVTLIGVCMVIFFNPNHAHAKNTLSVANSKHTLSVTNMVHPKF